MKGGKVETRRDFTDDRDEILRTLDQVAADSGPESSAVYDGDKQEVGLLAVIAKLGLIEGKKDLTYFTVSHGVGWPDRTQAVTEAAKWAGVTLRTFKIGGLPFSGAIAETLAHQGYVIGVEDVLRISVPLREGISGEYAVRSNGVIVMPRIGELQAAGLTIFELQKAIGNRLDQPWDSVEVTVIRSRQ